MTNYTPDSLRALAWIGKNGRRVEAIYAHADAWEAELWEARAICNTAEAKALTLEFDNAALREQADVDRSFIEQYQREVATLRKRLEAAEKRVELLKEGLYWHDPELVLHRLAALAGEEEKP